MPRVTSIQTALALTATLALAGCKAEVDLTLFTSDLIAATTMTEGMSAQTLLSFDAGTEAKCRELAPTIATAIAKGFPGAEFVECRKIEIATKAIFRVQVPITRANADLTTALSLWSDRAPTGLIGVVLKLDETRMEAIKAALPDEIRFLMAQQIEPSIRATVQNDATGPVALIVQGVFLDGKPYQVPETKKIDRRSEATIRLSDVGNTALLEGGSLITLIDDTPD